RRHANALPRHRAVGSTPDTDAAAPFLADALAVAESDVHADYHGSVGISLDGRAAAGERYYGSCLVLSIANDACRRWRYLGICATTIFSVCGPGARDLPKFQDTANS